MKWRIEIVLLLALLLPPALAAQPATTPIVFKLGTVAPSGSSYHRALLTLASRWKSTPGGADIRIYPGGIAGGEAEMLRKMKIGQIDAALMTANGMADIDPAVQSLQALPLFFRSLEEVDYVTSVVHPKLDKRLRDKGFVVLVWLDAGWVRFFSKTPIDHPDDLKRLKLFTWSGDTRTFDLYKSAGFQPVALETNDILPMLRTGMIAAVPTIPQIALGSQIFTATPYMLDLRWAPLVGALVVTERAWNRLTPAAQTAMAAAAADVGRQLKEANHLEGDAAVAAMQKRGLHVTMTTPATEAEWRSAAGAIYPRIRGGLVPADFFDEVQRILVQYRATYTAVAGAK
ncbi:MAG: TRAP-type transport system periplasmic protein [Thermoanaerobaculia bacterium]|jgi:TRAP-type C4-dicarboxylate transport system substrate-binding protein|nr:TRAP-type transport system periplasmic protein [Thermoanaerobaculia bacterium]